MGEDQVVKGAVVEDSSIEPNALREGGEVKADVRADPARDQDVLTQFEERDYTDEEFSEMLGMYEETMRDVVEGEVVTGTVLQVTDSEVVVDIGFKSEGIIPLEEFGGPEAVRMGDQIEVYLESVEDQEGQVVLSKQKADFMRVWDHIKEAHDTGQVLEGRLIRRIKGGIVVDLVGVEAFLPGSQIDIRQVKNFDQFIGETFSLKVIKLNKARRNIVVSRRMVLEEERERQRAQVLSELEVNQVRKGVVKNITDFGAFIDLGGVDGLLHITDMSWGRVSHPSELVAIGDPIEVKILNYDQDRERISLGLKQLTPYPWDNVEEKYSIGERVQGKVVSITDYGAFVELEEGVEGLIHISEMSWTHHIRHPSKVVSIGDMVNVVVLKVNKEEEKISLGLKQIAPDPWETIDERYPIGTKIAGRVRNLTNFGAFVEVEEGIDGLVHISDMSWTKRVHHPSEIMKKGDIVEVVILSIDKERRRVSLGYKQLTSDPWGKLSSEYAVGTEATGVIVRLLDRGVVVELDGDVEGFVPASQLAQPGIRKPEEAFQKGDELPLTVIEFDEKQRRIVLSVREYFKGKEREELEAYRTQHAPEPVTIGEVAEIPERGKLPERTPEKTPEVVEKVEEEVATAVLAEAPAPAAEQEEPASEETGQEEMSAAEGVEPSEQVLESAPEVVEKADADMEEEESLPSESPS